MKPSSTSNHDAIRAKLQEIVDRWNWNGPSREINLNVTIGEARALLALPLSATAGWIKCTDRLPEKDQHVLYYFEHVGIHAGLFKGGTCQGDALFVSRAGFLTGDVTDWMPVPPAPDNRVQEKP